MEEASELPGVKRNKEEEEEEEDSGWFPGREKLSPGRSARSMGEIGNGAPSACRRECIVVRGLVVID